jgi:CTP synthase (UTP-ammonia lyase)
MARTYKVIDADGHIMAAMRAREVTRPVVGIVGDFDARRPTHVATSQALAHAGIHAEWVPTVDVMPQKPEARLTRYAGLFIAPASPYRSMDGALAAIRLARERGVPLVGT